MSNAILVQERAYKEESYDAHYPTAKTIPFPISHFPFLIYERKFQ